MPDQQPTDDQDSEDQTADGQDTTASPPVAPDPGGGWSDGLHKNSDPPA